MYLFALRVSLSDGKVFIMLSCELIDKFSERYARKCSLLGPFTDCEGRSTMQVLIDDRQGLSLSYYFTQGQIGSHVGAPVTIILLEGELRVLQNSRDEPPKNISLRMRGDQITLRNGDRYETQSVNGPAVLLALKITEELKDGLK